MSIGAKKKQLLVDKPDDDSVVNAYDTTYDDYDFMWANLQIRLTMWLLNFVITNRYLLIGRASNLDLLFITSTKMRRSFGLFFKDYWVCYIFALRCKNTKSLSGVVLVCGWLLVADCSPNCLSGKWILFLMVWISDFVSRFYLYSRLAYSSNCNLTNFEYGLFS